MSKHTTVRESAAMMPAKGSVLFMVGASRGKMSAITLMATLMKRMMLRCHQSVSNPDTGSSNANHFSLLLLIRSMRDSQHQHQKDTTTKAAAEKPRTLAVELVDIG